MLLAKKYLTVLFQTLNGTAGELSLAEARIRDGFLKAVTEALQTFEAERQAIYEKFCIKDKDGKPDTTNNEYRFENGVLPEVNAELDILHKEVVELKPPETIKEIIAKTAYKPKVGEAELIDELISTI